jgi:hypothetical protein
MRRSILSTTALLSLVMMVMSGCGITEDKADSMKSEQSNKSSGGLQSDPKFHKLNSVVGEVKSGGKAVPGATVTIVATKETIPVEPSGFYVLVLDPAKLGKRPKELLFAAPGFAEQRHSVLVPENMQVRLDVELVPSIQGKAPGAPANSQ